MDHETSEDIKRHFNVVAEALRSDIRTLAEGLGANTERLERLENRFSEFDRQVATEFGETRAMIRLSYGEPERRIGSLESHGG